MHAAYPFHVHAYCPPIPRACTHISHTNVHSQRHSNSTLVHHNDRMHIEHGIISHAQVRISTHGAAQPEGNQCHCHGYREWKRLGHAGGGCSSAVMSSGMY
eukprot:366434-Chlamydomonas_euryale.AAC.1